MATAAMSSALPAHHLDGASSHDDPTTAAAPSAPQEAALEAAEVTLDASDVAAAAGNYATPHRRGALPAVTPAGGEDGPDAGNTTNSEEGIAGGGDAIVSASSAESTSPVKSQPRPASAHSPPRKQLVQPRAVAPSPLSVARAQSSIAPPVRKSAAAANRKIKSIATKPQQLKPSIQLGPRVTPAVRKAPPPRPAPRPAPRAAQVPKSTAKAQNKQQKPGVARQNSSSPINPRNLDGALQKGQPRGITAASTAGSASSQAAKFRAQTRALSQLASAATDVAAHAAASHQGSHTVGAVGGKQECPTTPARQVQSGSIPAPSSFLAAKISPLRSSARNRAKAAASAAVAGSEGTKRESTPPPQGADPKLSPGMFLSPRTPRTVSGGMGGTKSSGMTPRFTPGLTPTNFASDFGRGERKEGTAAQGGMSTLDASNVFAWLQTPTLGGAGMFSPSGGLHSLDTPRGMYGFQAPPGTAAKSGSGPPVLGDLGVDTPHVPESQRSMICISPLASKRSKDKAKAAAAGTAPDTPMSINFSEVFASPRFPSPRASRPPPGAHAGEGSSDAHASPVASALHSAERDVNLDDDLHALLQLAETTTPGGRPHMLLSPLLTNSLRRAHGQATPPRGGAVEPPMGLQLPIISGSSVALAPGSARKLSRKGSHGGAGGMPQLAIRTTSSGGMEGAPSPVRSSANPGRKGKKRKSPPPQEHYDPTGMSHYHGHPHPSMAPSPQHGYYHRPGYPAPPGHLSYPSAPRPPQYGAGPAKEASPAKAPAKKAKSSRSRSRSRAKTPAKAAAGDQPASRPGTPASAAGSSTGRRARKPARSAAAPRKSSSNNKNAPSSPAERERIATAIRAVNTVYGEGDQKKRKLAAATLRGVTMRPSGKWQAQLYYAGKSRYIGVFDSKEKASLAYEVAREVLKEEKGEGAPNADDTDRNVALARKAAFAGVNGA